MDEKLIDVQADNLVSKIKHYLITMMGITVAEANDEEFYRALCLTIREEIMINWTASKHTRVSKATRIVHYLCMEYMPGKMLAKNISNMHITDLITRVLKKVNRSLKSLYFIEPDPGLGNGGLGRLASCFLDSLATQQYLAIAYGLRYQYGIFEQELWNGVQIERPEAWLLHENPWEFRRDLHAETVCFAGQAVQTTNKKNVEVYDIVDYEEVRAVAYDFPIMGYKEEGNSNVVTLRLWTTKESPRNFELQRFNAGFLDQAAENTSLTDILYPNDNNEIGKRIRLKQEFLLVAASLQDILKAHVRHFHDISSFKDKVRIQINDTHPALAIAELMRLLIREHDFGWDEALETVQTCCSYTNHTVLKESLEEWNQNRLHYLLPRQYHIIERLNLELCTRIRQKFPGNEEYVRAMSIIEGGQIRMAHLAIFGAHKVNGVSALHSEILKKNVFKCFYEMYPEKFINVTNGVTQRRFLLLDNPGLSEFLTKYIGSKWIVDLNVLQEIAKYADDSNVQKEFLRIKQISKRKLIDYIKEKNPLRDAKGNGAGFLEPLGEDALFDVQIKRIHEYKRQLMNALHLIMIYHELKANPTNRKVKRMAIFAGKAAPGYVNAKNVIRLIFCIARRVNGDSAVNQMLKISFIENYNVSKAEQIIPAADLSEQISAAGTEASGTGNMKLTMNGALTIGTEDGANIEMREAVGNAWWPFTFGRTAKENADFRKDYNPWDIYMHNLPIRQALDALRDHTFALDEEEHAAFCSLYKSLLEPETNHLLDPYFVISDLQAYYETQKKVEDLYATPEKWAQYALHNIAGMGNFSSDNSIHNYAKLIWDVTPCPLGDKELARVRDEYSEHDRCRILGN